MNESTGKTASCLAITEKRTHKPGGGCVGIFFQLFDWNRRFAKKKLFSRKLLPPARANQASKKFGGDEKMPKTKLHLIADENSGGFPNVKKNGNRGFDMEQKHEMKAPGLVARLMGLESMPAIQRDKPKKAAFSSTCDVKEEQIFNNCHGGSSREDLNLENLEKGNSKLESRPEKMQRTGSFERRAVTRFGAEALQFKSVLSRSRKHLHHQKLASPLKSPRISSARSASRTSRLIDAATKILEPGLQATNRAKSALTYSNSMPYTSEDEHLIQEIVVMSPDLAKQSDYNANIGKSMMGQTSCKNRGDLLDVVHSRPNVEEQSIIYLPLASNFVNASTQGLGKNKTRTTICSLQQESEVVFQRSTDQPVTLAAQEKGNMRSSGESIADRKPLSQQVIVQWHSTSQQSKPQKDEPASIAFKHRTQIQNQTSLSRDRIPPRAKSSNLQSRRVSSAANAVSGAKDFVALNRSLSGRPRLRVPTKVDSSTSDTQKISSDRRDESLSQVRSPIRKRRTVSVNGQVESTCFSNSTLRRQTNASCDVVSGKQIGLNAHHMDRTCIKNQLASQGELNRANGNKDSNVISFTFNSPLRHKTRIPTGMKEKIKDQSDFPSKRASHQRKLVLDEYDGQTSLQKQCPLRGDALGALLEQKLKELTSQEEDEMTMGTTAPKRSSAMILQELIYALTAEQPVSQDGHVFNRDIAFQNKAKTEGNSVGFSHDGDHLSPGSVLEASFSNDSYVSSSQDDISGHRLHFDSMDYSYNQPQPTEPDADLLDSATSWNQGRNGTKMVTDFVNQISRMLHSINNGGLGLMENKLTYAKEVIMNAELLFGNVTLHDANRTNDLLIGPSLLYKLDTLAGAMWTNLHCLLGFDETKEGNQIRGFLFDCVVECLDSKYSRYCNSGFKSWRRLPLLHMNAEMLIQEVGIELRRWTQLAGMVVDEILEWEWNQSLAKWMDFDIEAFETGTDIDCDILQVLVEEVVIDLWECQLSCS